MVQHKITLTLKSYAMSTKVEIDGSEVSVEDVPREKRVLEGMRVIDLRHKARDVCGSGTWISHAKKSELVSAILEGEPPASAIEEENAIRERITSLRDFHAESTGLEAIMVQMIDDIIGQHLRTFKADLLAALDEGGVSELRKRLEEQDGKNMLA